MNTIFANINNLQEQAVDILVLLAFRKPAVTR